MKWGNTVTNSKWILLAKPRRGEHSLWRKSDDPDSIYVADCSGSNPDRTEDGPLKLVGELHLRVGGSCGVTADVRVIREDTTPAGYTGLHADVALWLVKNAGFRAVFADDDLRIAALLLAAASP